MSPRGDSTAAKDIPDRAAQRARQRTQQISIHPSPFTLVAWSVDQEGFDGHWKEGGRSNNILRADGTIGRAGVPDMLSALLGNTNWDGVAELKGF
jgi:hypothetical protein